MEIHYYHGRSNFVQQRQGNWANLKFENLIFLLGSLHICFNLKVIGKLTLKASLDYLWTESGMYATNIIKNVLDGKRYYRTGKGHHKVVNVQIMEHQN